VDEDGLAAAVASGDHRTLAKALSTVERGGAAAGALLARLGGTGGARTVGVTGAPGVGKSSLVQALGLELMTRGGSIAVLAVDPSSPFTGGALLGDRVRMPELTGRGAFVRSMASRGALGGLAAATSDAVDVLAAAGFDWVLIETVGVGQDEVDIAGVADTVVVVTTAGSGDDVQAAKAGLLEIGDVFVVNKADRPGADEQLDLLAGMLALRAPGGWAPPLVRASALTGEGVPELAGAVAEHQRHLGEAGARAGLRRRRAERRVELALAELARNGARQLESEAYARTVAAVAVGELDPYSAAASLWQAIAPGAGDVLDHIGIAVRSLAERAAVYQALGLEVTAEETVAEQKVRVAFLPVAGSRLELLEPTGPESPIAGFLAKRGEGLHHLCFRVDDIAATMARLRAAGLTLLSAEPQPGAHGAQVCFIHPRSTGGVLIELSQPAGGRP
jgi:LAO/AO transport system kinase